MPVNKYSVTADILVGDMKKETIIGLIPARSGSKRCPNKNTRMLGGKPLIAWTIKSALESRIFTDIVVSTDSEETMEIAASYGASAILRPSEISQDTSTDYEWIKHAIETLDCKDDAFGILRPTNPFRTAKTIRACWDKFRADSMAENLRTMRAAKEHPLKMWMLPNDYQYALPICLNGNDNCSYDLPTQSLFTPYIQDGLFYISMIDSIMRHGILTGEKVISYITSYPENLDINTEQDFLTAEAIAYGH